MVRWRTVASGSSSTETQQKLQLASERTELENLWTPVLRQNRSQPIVDFNKDRIVVIFLGTRNTGGYSAQVREVGMAGGTSCTVFVNELVPGPNQKTTQGQTSPWVMIAVDRSYLDISAKIQKVEDNRLPSYQINPLTSFTPVPWDGCGYGYGGSWSDPCGYGFDSINDFRSWCDRNRCDYPTGYNGIDFNSNRLVFVSAGDYGLGYGIQIGDVFLSGGETVIQVQRNSVRLTETQRSYLLVSLSRQSRRYAVEYLVNGQDCYLGGGRQSVVRQSGAWVFRTNAEWEKASGGTALPDGITSFDYKTKNLAFISMGDQPPAMTINIDRVAYRGNTAYVYLNRGAVSGIVSANSPYFILKLDKKVTNIKVVDPASR